MCRAISTTTMMKAAKRPITKTPTLRKRRRVRFSANDQNLNEKSFLSEEEIQNTWYSRAEERSFKKEAVKELTDFRRRNHYNLMKNMDVMESVPRGLERHTKERRMHKKQLVKFVVLAHQRGYHPEDIAKFSQMRSSWNTDLATTQATIDQIEVLLDADNYLH